MGASRAILADIHDLKLDPTVAHGSTNKKGRLSDTNKTTPTAMEMPLPQIPEDKLEAIVPKIVEEPVAVQVVEVQEVTVVAETVDALPVVDEPVVELAPVDVDLDAKTAFKKRKKS